MISRPQLAALPDGAVLVDVARGKLVDTEALLAETSTRRIRAELSVTNPEPLPPEHPLWRTPGVLISPHVGGPSAAFFPRADRLIAAQLGRFAAGAELKHHHMTPLETAESPRHRSRLHLLQDHFRGAAVPKDLRGRTSRRLSRHRCVAPWALLGGSNGMCPTC